MGDGDIHDFLAGGRDDVVAGDEASDLKGEITATITEISILNGTCQPLY